jgi:branched-chain amino acid transport system permease protein
VTQFLQHLIDALSLGSTYALLALGLTLLFSVMGLINFAYGDTIVWCGYGFTVAASLGIGFWASVPLIILGAVAMTVAIWWVAFRPFRDANQVTLLLSSFGVALALEAAAVMIFGPSPKGIAIPNSLGHVFFVGGLRVPLIELITVVVAAVLIVGLYALLNRSNLGLGILATAENRSVAETLGVRGERTVFMVFVISGLIVGIVAVLLLSTLGAVTSTSGLSPTIKAFIAIVLGGLGSIRGAVWGGLLLGALETFMNAWLPGSLLPYQEALVFVVVILILSWRPGGLVSQLRAETR